MTMRSLPVKIWRRLRKPSASPAKPSPDWASLLKTDSQLWSSAVNKAANGPHILIATSAGGFLPGLITESTLAVALTLRGAQVHVLLCDEVLPACIQATVHSSNPKQFAEAGPQATLCQQCFAPGYATYLPLGLKVHRYGEF